MLNRAYDVLTNPILKERYDKYGRKGLGTSAASDELKTRGKNINTTPKRIVSSYVVAKSDAGDVKWKGSHGGPPYEVVAFGTAPISERALGSSRDRSVQSPSSSLVMDGPKKIPMRDLYQILSVQRGASEGEIKYAYEFMSKRYDPGTNHLLGRGCNTSNDRIVILFIILTRCSSHTHRNKQKPKRMLHSVSSCPTRVRSIERSPDSQGV